MFRTIFLEAVNGMAPIYGRTNMIRHTTLALAFAAAAIATPVAAAIKIATYSGFTNAVFDQTGVFGRAGTSFALPYVVTFTYDTSINRSIDPVYGEELRGGDDFGGPTPIIDAKLTINGITRRFESQSAYGVVSAFPLSYGVSLSHGVSDVSLPEPGVGNTLGIGTIGSDVPSSLDANFTAMIGGGGGGSFQIYTLDAFGGVESDAFGEFSSAGTISVTNAVPEPAAWAMMIAGFGMIGGAMRRRTAQLA